MRCGGIAKKRQAKDKPIIAREMNCCDVRGQRTDLLCGGEATQRIAWASLGIATAWRGAARTGKGRERRGTATAWMCPGQHSNRLAPICPATARRGVAMRRNCAAKHGNGLADLRTGKAERGRRPERRGRATEMQRQHSSAEARDGKAHQRNCSDELGNGNANRGGGME